MPVLLPVMFILEVWLLKRMWNQKVRLRNTISEIYLHKNGEEIEIVYMNRFFVGAAHPEKIEEGITFQILLDANVSVH